MSDSNSISDLTEDERKFFDALSDVYKKFNDSNVRLMVMLLYHSSMLGNIIAKLPEKEQGEAFSFAGDQAESALRESISPTNFLGMPIVGRA